MSNALTLMQKGWQSHKQIAGSSALKLASSMSGKAMGGFGRALMHPVGGTLLIGGALSVLTHDPTKHSLAQHMSIQAPGLFADAAFEGVAAAAFGIPGVIAATALAVAGFSPGQLMTSMAERADQQARRLPGGARRSITQNENTMRATQRNLGLLGQSGKYGMLGQEAQMMHN